MSKNVEVILKITDENGEVSIKEVNSYKPIPNSVSDNLIFLLFVGCMRTLEDLYS